MLVLLLISVHIVPTLSPACAFVMISYAGVPVYKVYWFLELDMIYVRGDFLCSCQNTAQSETIGLTHALLRFKSFLTCFISMHQPLSFERQVLYRCVRRLLLSCQFLLLCEKCCPVSWTIGLMLLQEQMSTTFLKNPLQK